MSLSQRLFLFRVIHATLLDFKPTSLLNDHVLRPPSCVTKACHLQAACAALKSAPKKTHPSNFNMADRHSKGDRNTSFQVAVVCSEPRVYTPCSMRMTDKLGVICMVEGDIQIPTACSWFRKHSHQWFTLAPHFVHRLHLHNYRRIMFWSRETDWQPDSVFERPRGSTTRPQMLLNNFHWRRSFPH